MFIDEARVASRIHHPNVVSTLDVIEAPNELGLVMEYVHGEALSRLWSAARRRGERIPVPIAAAILLDMLHGLHAAHEATDQSGKPLDIVHRDVSRRTSWSAPTGSHGSSTSGSPRRPAPPHHAPTAP